MPMSDPEKVQASPKAMSTESWISPGGGMMNPAMSSPTPTKNTTTAMASWIFSLIFSMALEEIARRLLLVFEAPFILKQFRNRVALPFGVQFGVVADVVHAPIEAGE